MLSGLQEINVEYIDIKLCLSFQFQIFFLVHLKLLH